MRRIGRVVRTIKEWKSFKEALVVFCSLIFFVFFISTSIGKQVYTYIAYFVLATVILVLCGLIILEILDFYKTYKVVKKKELEELERQKQKDVIFFLDFEALKYCSKYFYATYVIGTTPTHPDFENYYLKDKNTQNVYYATTAEYIEAIKRITENGDKNNSFPGYDEYIRAHFIIMPLAKDQSIDVDRIILGDEEIRVESAYCVKANIEKYEDATIVLAVYKSEALLDAAEQIGIENVVIVS